MEAGDGLEAGSDDGAAYGGEGALEGDEGGERAVVEGAEESGAGEGGRREGRGGDREREGGGRRRRRGNGRSRRIYVIVERRRRRDGGCARVSELSVACTCERRWRLRWRVGVDTPTWLEDRGQVSIRCEEVAEPVEVNS